jgi:hypothetical protein
MVVRALKWYLKADDVALWLFRAPRKTVASGRFGGVPYFSQPRWRKYRNGAIALTTIRPSDQP